MPINPVDQYGRRLKRQSLPESFRKMVNISIGLFADRFTGSRVVIANQLCWFRAPLTLEFRESRMSVRHFAKIKPAKAGVTCFLDCERENRVVWAQRKIFSPGSVESIENRLDKH